MSNNTNLIIAGIFDLHAFPWGQDLFDYTVQKLKDENPAYYSGLNHVVVNGGCDETTAVRAYWDLRMKNNEAPVHGIVGARCSGASVSLARISGLEEVNMVSPSSTSSVLSDDEEFPFFSRLVAPDDSRGEVGAIVETLKWFGWTRVSVLSTDTTYAKDFVGEFRKLWEKDFDIAYSNVIRLDANGNLDFDSVDMALRSVPTDDPANNSRIILLVAHDQHAYPILQRADEIRFQPDTVWVGTSSWIGNPLVENIGSNDWIGSNEHPGYIGLGPIHHPNAEAYLKEFNAYRRNAYNSDLEECDQFPVFATEMIDSITALARAIYSIPEEENRRNGMLVRNQLRDLSFDGATGHVSFTTVGDRQNPQYSILHLKRTPRTDNYCQVYKCDESLKWVTVGESGTASASADPSQMCFATFGCDLDQLPSDSYPVPPPSLPFWIIALLIILIILLIVVAAKYWRSRNSKRNIKRELETFRDSVVGMRTAVALYLPSTGEKVQDDIEAGGNNQSIVTVQWCWKETDNFMSKHDAASIVGDGKNCWIKYTDSANKIIEDAFQKYQRKNILRVPVSPLPGYVVDFQTMRQKKIETGYLRNVLRIVKTTSADGSSSDPLKALPATVRTSLTSSEIKYGADLPDDIKNEPQMVLVPGDVVQISKQKKDTDWAFGTKLYHYDENIARLIVSAITNSSSNNTVKNNSDNDTDVSNVFADTGWFQMEASTRVPTTDDLKSLKQNVGDTDALNAPSHWNSVKDPSIVQVQNLNKNDAEYGKVEAAFNSSLNNNVKIESIKRIENLAMWQSYVVKRQTIISREIGQDSLAGISDDADIRTRQRQRLERCWLWHGTNVEVMDKILQQGFNRSFCGKNATMYGKGVYFARDTSYSASRTYAVPDWKGYQYIMACRVVVGEYCPGIRDALTPGIRDAKTHSLYDSTVNSMNNPSIYVTYHDAQAYPEYLIKFKMSYN